MSDERGGEQRRRELAAICIAKAATRMSDENYRLLVGQITGGRSDSAGKMDWAERRTLLGWFAGHGWVNPAKPLERAFKPARKAQARLVWALWHELKSRGVLDNPSREACRAFCARTAKIEAATDPDLMNPAQLDPVIAALKAWVARAKAKGAA